MSSFEFDQLPTSFIRSPGDLLKDKKDPSKIKVNKKYLENLFLRLNNLSCSLSTSSGSLGKIEPALPMISGYLSSSFVLHSASKSSSPMSNDLPIGENCQVIQMSEQILFTFGLKLEFLGDIKHNKDICSFLKRIIQLIGVFPSGLFKVLQMKKVIIYTGSISREAFSLENVYFCYDLLDTREKVQYVLYKTIFDQILVTKPELLKEWKKIKAIEDSLLKPKNNQTSLTLEEVFMKLMKKPESINSKPLAARLKEILMRQFIEEMTEEWFENLQIENREK